MSRLATRAEIEKLASVLGVGTETLGFLDGVPADQLRTLREAIYEHLFGLDAVLFRRLAALARRLPARLVAFLGKLIFGPLVTARIAGELPARRAVAISQRMSTAFLADVCPHFDPRCARDLIRLMPNKRIVEVALELIARRDYLTMGRLVDFLPDEAVHAVDEATHDEEVLVRIAFFVESKTRLDHLVRLMPRERIRRAILLVLDESKDILPQVASLIIHVSYALKRELGDLAAEQDDAVLSRVVHFAQAEGLWPEVLPVIAAMSESSQRKVLNLPIFRQQPAVVETIVRTADERDLWSLALPLVHRLDDEMRRVVADVAAGLPRAAMERVATAALMGEHWDALLDVVRRMPLGKQLELAEIVDSYGAVDPQLRARVRARAEAFGLQRAFTPPESRGAE